MYKPSYPGSYYFDTFTFTTMGNSGHRGPLPTQKYANAPWGDSGFSIVDGQQQWTVPATGTYQITAAGAYGAKPGRVVTGQVSLAQDQVLSLLVGQQPTPLTANVVDNVTVGGGGGTFVTSGGKPLMVASGGDGGAYLTGYLPTEFVIPNTIQFSLSMSADGTVMVALNVDVNTFQYEYAVYRYSSGVWNFERSFPNIGDGVFLPTISGNGNTILLFSPQNIRVFEYVDSEWTGPYLITDVTPWYTLGARSFSISYDGYTVILSIQAVSRDEFVYVCTKNQDLTWNSLIQIQPADVGVNYFKTNSTQVAISGDGTSICVNTEDYMYPSTKKAWVYTRTGESTWGSPVLLSSGSEPFQQIDMSYDGQTIALLLADSNSAMIWLRVYTNGILSKDITLPYFQPSYLAGVIKLSYDGSLLMFAQYFNVTVYTSDSQITVSDTANDLPYAAASMNSTGSLIVNSSISLTNPITYFFEAGGTGQSGSFLPPGTGSGISGAGYLTDGQVSNPYFGFMKPQAYVDGGVGNTYQYGAQGEGGFGGGQSPLNKKTDLTSIIGYKQVRPSIPVNGVRQMNSIALSDDGNTFLASGQRLSGTPLNFTNVYTYTDSTWINTNISDALACVSTSANGSIWLINGDVWRNGSFETTLGTLGSFELIPGQPRSCISSDGNTAVVLSADFSGPAGIPPTLNVYTYSAGTWHITNLSVSQEVIPYIIGLQCAISGDGNTIALILSWTTNYPNYFSYVDVYKKVDGTWSSPNRIFTNISASGPLGINSNGSEIVFSKFLYSNGTITPFPGVENISFSRTNPDFYVYSIGNNIYAPSISLDVTVYINDKNSYVASGSTIVATTDSSSPRAFVFVDMYNPTTTCTATTSVPHGYPYNYKVQITGTNSFDGTWDIKAPSSNTFTFQAFGGPDETAGYVSGTTTGISGGGGYTGSPGDGVSGATCYADPSVVNFTDLGAASNSAGYVNVTLVNPVPLKQTWTWDPTQQWTLTNAVALAFGEPVWSSSHGLFIVPAGYQKVIVSPDGLAWSAIQTNLPALTYYSSYYVLLSSTNGILLAVSSETGYVYRSINVSTWTLTLSSYIDRHYSVFINNLFILRGYNNATVYTSPDGTTWTTITPNVIYESITYGKSKYIMTRTSTMYTSTDLTTWTPVLDSNVATSINGWSSVLFDNETFVALRSRYSPQIQFYSQNTNMSPRPEQMINDPIYNITSLTFTGIWGDHPARVGDTLPFASIYNFGYTVSPATYGTVTAVDSGSVTVSLVSSTITVQSLGPKNDITLDFTRDGTDYTIVTSPDGINWYGRTTPSNDWTTLISGGGSFIALNYYGIYLGGNEMYSTDKGVTWAISAGNAKGAKSGVYSPTLKYFLFTNGDIFYISLDGSIIVPAISGGSVGKPYQVVWADTLGILVAVTSYSIITSTDGITWKLVLNLKPDGTGSDSDGQTVSWSPDLGLLVAYFRNGNTSNSPLLYTSTDGVTWSQTVLSQAFTPDVVATLCKPCWSPQLGLFTNGESTSRDGINWVFGSGASAPPLSCAAWSPELNLFVGGGDNNSFYSYDGVLWSISDSSVMRSIAWSPSLKLFVGVGEQAYGQSPFLIYTSSTGTNWTQVYSDGAANAIGGSVTWSPELNVFVCAYVCVSETNSDVRVFTSSNGVSWTYRGTNIIQASDGGDLIWSSELKIFLFTLRYQSGMFTSIPAITTL